MMMILFTSCDVNSMFRINHQSENSYHGNHVNSRFWLVVTLFLLIVNSLIQCSNGQDFYAGYYSYHPAYLNDEPNVIHYSKRMLYGLPKGGYSMSGKPFGLTAYLFKLKDWDNLWTQYYSLESAYAPVRYFGHHGNVVDDVINFWR